MYLFFFYKSVRFCFEMSRASEMRLDTTHSLLPVQAEFAESSVDGLQTEKEEIGVPGKPVGT